jgi:site-specific recombinase XerD
MGGSRRVEAGRGLPAAWRELWETYEILKRSSVSPATLANYLDTLVQLARFLGLDVPPLERVTRRQVAEFIEDVKQRTPASTAGMRYRGLSAVFGWLAAPGDGDEPYIEQNPMKGLRHPKVEEDPVPVLDYDEVRRLLAACRGDRFEDRRDEAIIQFLFDTGWRRGEVASMRVDGDWLNLRDGKARVEGKTGPRLVSLGDKTAAAIKRYLRIRSRHPRHDEPWLWLGRRGRLLGNGIYQALDARYEAAGIEASKKAHIFRHSFSHYFRLEGGSDSELTTGHSGSWPWTRLGSMPQRSRNPSG